MFKQGPTGVTKRKNKLLYFDNCVFPYCLNGKHNGHILFRLPVNPKRQQQWLNIIGNPLLEGYSRNYLASKAGVCKNHFDPDDFTNAAQNKLQRCVYPMRSTPKTSADYHTNALNLCASEYPRNCSTPKVIATTDEDLRANNFLEAYYRKMYFPNAISPVPCVNDENMNFPSDEEKAPRHCHGSFRKNIIKQFNNRVAEGNFEPHASLSNCASESSPHNTAGIFEKSEIQISASSLIEDTSNSKKSKKDVFALKEQNIIFKQKFTKDAKLKREKLHYFVRLMNERKKIELERNC